MCSNIVVCLRFNLLCEVLTIGGHCLFGFQSVPTSICRQCTQAGVHIESRISRISDQLEVYEGCILGHTITCKNNHNGTGSIGHISPQNNIKTWGIV